MRLNDCQFLAASRLDLSPFTVLRRFLRILRDTNQIDFEQATHALAVLAGRG